MKRIDALHQMHVITNQIAKSLEALKPSMDDNEQSDLDGINNIINRREETIKLLDEALKAEGNDWSTDERHLLEQLSGLEETIQPKLSELYAAFSDQMRRLQQGKSVAGKYKAQSYTDGAFFDQRK
ncbi:hypothetical protein [Pseudalkalibacillus hwajinpoensis]|uniref:Flagellar protein FliT n=1 Tax=Guptibacillus hwajinpoensis TaxID=208199 RepID=A0A4U1MGX5_9BACL|nr:hypothetical protein [Pseudalkalibacillus hwajinpoensis]TKD70529.1 hypothetical protein FBF83_07820 [Pseudalkalibacillus hwajinpoensis]